MIGENLRARRLSLNLSQAEAAARSGTSVSTVKNLEAGRGSSVWVLASLCRTYNHDGWILALAPEESLLRQLEEAEHPRQRAAKRKAVARV